MSIPKFYEFFGSFLRAIQDGKIHKSKEVQQFIAEDMNLSDADLLEMLPSGRQSTFGNRVNWARTYLDKAGLIETPSRGQYRITDVGKAALNSGDTIDLKYLEQFEAFQRFHTVQHGNESLHRPVYRRCGQGQLCQFQHYSLYETCRRPV